MCQFSNNYDISVDSPQTMILYHLGDPVTPGQKYSWPTFRPENKLFMQENSFYNSYTSLEFTEPIWEDKQDK